MKNVVEAKGGGTDNVDPVENSIMAVLRNIHGQESNTRRVKFQYYPF